ncbi:MAG: protein kinase domain-containing protein [Bryobacteraceae bacterium]
MSDSAEHWRALEELYQAALGREPTARAAFLSEACPNESLRREVQSLLDARGAGDDLLERPAIRWAAQPLGPGAVLGQYRIEQSIGAGGMGDVYKARDSRLDREVALKILPAYMVGDAERRARFIREARAAARLNHPNSVTIYDIGEQDGRIFIAMEYVDGKTLDTVIPAAGLPTDDVLKYAIPIAAALDKAHAAGIVHRDLKPGNIMIDRGGSVKVLDFGLAKLIEEPATSDRAPDSLRLETQTGMFMGTPAFMSPEQAEGKPVDPRSDIFSFGAVLYQMATGKRAFTGNSLTAVMVAVIHKEPDPAVENVVPDLEKIIHRCLRKDPELRFQSMADVGVCLEELRRKVFERRLTPTHALSAGTKLGPYEILALISVGGMGEVYRARDLKLEREVAIQVPAAGRSRDDPERLARFEREAKVLASVNHPHIVRIFGVEGGALVMELVDGETLLARLKRGKLSILETFQYGAQIADALAAAHAKGIMHGDLRPANIILTKSGVKVTDFGQAESAADPAYMAPEQFERKNADVRTDIYALGLVLADMATGKQTSSGRRGSLPPVLDRVVNRCTEKDPDERCQSARDLRWELESIAGSPMAASSRSRIASIAIASVFVTLLAAALAFVEFREPAPPQQAARVSIMLPEKSRVLSLAVSPDGRHIAMVLVKEGKQQIWVRSLDALEPTALAGTDDAADPFWSPDSLDIAFFADAKLKRIERSGGPVQTLCDALAVLGGTWNRSGDILMGGLTHVERVSAAGGAVSDLPQKAAARDVYPFFLPDGRHYLSTRGHNVGLPEAGVWLNSMDGAAARRILPDISNAEIVEPPTRSQVGEVLFTRDGTMMALPFDMKRLQAAGDAFPVAQRIAAGSDAYYLAATSKQGVVAYMSRQRGSRQYVWWDRKGKNLGAAGDAGNAVAISPDGKRLLGDHNGNRVLEFSSGMTTQLTSGDRNTNPIWSPDGRYIAYWGKGGIYRMAANGAGAEELLVRATTLVAPKSWSPDGRFLMYAQISSGTQSDLLAIPVEPDAKPFVVVETPANEDQGQFSPDGHWVAYTSNESGLSEIYVIPFPPSSGGGKQMVSRGGGVQPRWRHDGKELFYISPDSKMMAVEVNTQPVFQSSNPQTLFLTQIVDTGIRTGPTSWDVAPNGRFLIITESSIDASLTLALNWRAATIQ